MTVSIIFLTNYRFRLLEFDRHFPLLLIKLENENIRQVKYKTNRYPFAVEIPERLPHYLFGMLSLYLY